ncbi:MAG TPA: ANTAR domain-containing protein [Nitrospirae bacterium]|nr:ANTAR domain-containing protein [Nitrospirota bacterium]
MMERLREEEERNMKRLRVIVDLAQALLMQTQGISPEEAFIILNNTKRAVLNLFPDKEEVYDLIYTPRFKRIIAERFTIPGSLSGRN